MHQHQQFTMDDHPLIAFLESRRIKAGTTSLKPSLTGMGKNFPGKWYVSDEDYPAFLDNLYDYLFAKQKRPLNLVEQRMPTGVSPLLIDLDFRYPSESAIKRQFRKENIKAFTRMYINTLTELYNVSDIAGPLRFFVTLRPLPYEEIKPNYPGKILKDGIHIECPDCVLTTEIQQIVRLSMLEQDAVKECFGETGYVNNETDIYDLSVIRNAGWFYFGESKASIPPYDLAYVWSYDPQADDMVEESTSNYTPRKLMELLSIRYNKPENVLEVNEEAEEKVSHYKYLVQKPAAVAAAQQEEAALALAPTPAPQPSSGVSDSWSYSGYSNDEIMLARRLVIECLSSQRADGYSTWIEVGWCLHSIDSSEEMFNTWMEFSAKSRKFSANNTERLRLDWISNWRRPETATTLKMGSLHLWAKTDNAEKYREIIEDDIINYIEYKIDVTPTHIARLMRRLYGDMYKAAVSGRKSEWYEFKDNTWRRLAQGIAIRNRISTDIAELNDKARARTRRRMFEQAEKDEMTKAIEEQRMKRLLNLEKQLYATAFKDNVMKEAAGLFYEDEFMEKLNCNPYLLGTGNGVIELRADTGYKNAAGEVIYKTKARHGCAEDHVSFQVGRQEPELDAIVYTPYDPVAAKSDPIHAEINDFFSKVFPDKDLRGYIWRLLASCLEGANKEQCFYIWIGVGGNGKSKLVELVRMTLGDYVTSLQATALTRKRPDAGAANPEIIAIRNKRFIYLQEPDEREPMNTSRMKQFSGEDMVEARGLFEDQTRFKVAGKLHMMCNRLPPIQSMDKGTWRRIRVIPFVSKFVEPDSKDIDPSKNIYPRDDNLDMKMLRWRSAFFAKLVWVYENEYLKAGLAPIPNVVMQASEQYKESFDAFSKFKNMLVRSGGDAVGNEVSVQEVWRAYSSWHQEHATGPKINQQEFLKRLEETFGEPEGKKKVFKHIVVFANESEADEWDIANSSSGK
jgi:P4 family phage/plasmid primase-like protien